MGTYIKSRAVFECPDDPSGPTAIGFPSSYPVNAFCAWDGGQGLFTYSYFWGGHNAYCPEGANGSGMPVVTNASLTRPTDLIVLSDGYYQFSAYVGAGIPNNEQGDAMLSTGQPVFGITQPWEVNQIAIPLDTNLGVAWHKHSDGANFLFADGHVKWMRPSQLLNSNLGIKPENWFVNSQ